MTGAEFGIQSFEKVESEPQETYGSGPTLLRLGNGGAGKPPLAPVLTQRWATGILRALADEYLSTRQTDGSIAWICNRSRNTLLALQRNYIDISLTYERDQEALAAREGWSTTKGCAFHDHFVLAGPISDPAGLRNTSTKEEAFTKLASLKGLFQSRVDNSATMWRERSIWLKSGLTPWQDDAARPWYKTSVEMPAEALVNADKTGAYLLTDRATLLRQTALRTISRTTVFFEPTHAADDLLNSCYASCSSKATAHQASFTSDFLEFLFSETAQHLVAAFGREGTGLSLFAPAREGFARDRLAGGRPVDGKWTFRSPDADESA